MHKKTFNIASICIVILIVVFSITQKQKNNLGYTNNIQTEGSVIGEIEKDASEQYREEVLKTIIEQNIKSFESTSESFKRKPTDTLSEIIAKNTFAQYIDFNTTNSLDVEQIAAETAKALKSNPVVRSNVGIESIKIIDNSLTSLHSYGNQIGNIQDAVAKGVYKIKDRENTLIYIRNIYKTAADLYKKTPVPKGLYKEHLGIINGYMDYVNGFDLLELQDTDPAKALSGIELAKNAQDLLINSFSSIKKIVLLNKIDYKENEPAYTFFIKTAESESIKLN